MPDDDTIAARPSQIALPPILDIAAAAELKRNLLEALGANGHLNVDASAVQRVTTPCLQILVAAASAIQGAGGRMRLHSVPRVLSETIGMLGLSEFLGMGDA